MMAARVRAVFSSVLLSAKPQAAGVQFDADLYRAARPLDRMKVQAAIVKVFEDGPGLAAHPIPELLDLLQHNLTTALKECDLPLDMVQKPKKSARPLTAYHTGGTA